MTHVGKDLHKRRHPASSAYLKFPLRSQEHHRSHLLKVKLTIIHSQNSCFPMVVFSYSFSALILITACSALLTRNVAINNFTDRILPNLPNPDHISCLPRVYGVNPNKESCINAWEKIPRTTSEEMYTSRTRATSASISIPIRFQSDDGRCVIDIRSKRRDTLVIEDITRGIDISDAAGNIIVKCMQEQSRLTSGGSIYGFSEYRCSAPCFQTIVLPLLQCILLKLFSESTDYFFSNTAFQLY